jgi:glyoxylase-like metal-dependent hydrolase (beta-lactamase superfamily II)
MRRLGHSARSGTLKMRLVLHGGFGEKGRTCVGVEAGDYRMLIDAGVKTSAQGRDDYYPAVSVAQLRDTDAIVVTHGHEDHAGALGWLLANGFTGRMLMTGPTQRDADDALGGYASPADHARVRAAAIEHVRFDAVLALGPLRVALGRSGHIAGGVWCVVDDGRARFAFCGDVVPASPVFRMDPIPRCDVIALDASYADDDVPASARAAQIAHWVAAHPGGCVLPTPLYGRSAELLAIVPGAIALAPGMRAALQAQLDDADWLLPGAPDRLRAGLAHATDWHPEAPLPAAALICHDGMGMAGPARDILARASQQRHPTLFTGHVPAGSAGAVMLADACADWIRLPTHPTLSENVALAAASRVVLGHSCDPDALVRLAEHVPALRVDAATGDTLDL